MADPEDTKLPGLDAKYFHRGRIQTLLSLNTSDFQRRTLNGWTLKMAMAQPKVSQSTGGFCLSSRIYMWYYPDPQHYRFPLTYLKDSSCGRCYAQQTVWLSVILYTHLHVLSPQDFPPPPRARPTWPPTPHTRSTDQDLSLTRLTVFSLVVVVPTARTWKC